MLNGLFITVGQKKTTKRHNFLWFSAEIWPWLFYDNIIINKPGF